MTDANVVDPKLLSAETSGLIGELFRIMLGNPDVITVIASFAIFITCVLVAIEVYHYIR